MRFLAIAYTDVFRGFPAIVVIYLVVFGMQLADLDKQLPIIGSMNRDDRFFWLITLSLVLVYGAYVAEVYRAGLESIHWSQTAAARSLGPVLRADACATSSSPRRCGASSRRCSTTSSPCRRTPRCCRAVGALEVAGRARHHRQHELQPLADHRRRALLPHHHHPAHPPHRLPRQARPSSACRRAS